MHDESTFSGTTQAVRARAWLAPLGVAVLLALLLAMLGPLAARAGAEPRIKVSGCKVYATNRVDPIAFTQHLHHHFGSTSTTNQSTANSLMANTDSSCDDDEAWYTSAGWFPVERNEPVTRVSVYYRAPGDQTQVKAIPKGLQLLASDQAYRCNNTASEEPWQDTPPYNCKTKWDTDVIFPDCININRLADESTNAVSSNNGVCPSTHPYRIPKIRYLLMHDNVDGVVPNPLQVSAGVNSWESWRSMHGDYLAANQRVFNRELLDLCLRDAPDSVTVADARCGERAPHNVE
jgi:hypothetical protein